MRIVEVEEEEDEANITTHEHSRPKADLLDALGHRGDSSNRFGLL